MAPNTRNTLSASTSAASRAVLRSNSLMTSNAASISAMRSTLNRPSSEASPRPNATTISSTALISSLGMLDAHSWWAAHQHAHAQGMPSTATAIDSAAMA